MSKRGRRYTEDQIFGILRELEGGSPVSEVARLHGVSPPTLRRWSERYGGMSRTELGELRRLREENRRLRSVVASQALDIEAYKELQRGKW